MQLFACRKAALAAAALFFALAAPASAQLRVVQYNVSAVRSGLSTVLQGIADESRNGIARPIDVLTLEEQDTLTGPTQDIVNLLNSIYGEGTYARGQLNAIATPGSGGQPAVIYNTTTVQLLAEAKIGAPSTSGQPRYTMRYQLRPVGYTAAANFFVYASHMKASPGEDEERRRDVEADAIRTNSNALGANQHIIYAGDYNFYTSSEDGYQSLLAAGEGQAFDPINTPGSWHDGAAYKLAHTQSPATSSHYSGQVLSGVDDRFDFQLVTGEMLDNEGLSYIANSYRSFGNNGTHALGGAIGTGTGASPAILSALEGASDHLPVVADYQLPAKMSVAVAAPAAVIKGGSASAAVTVSNVAPVLVAIGADELDYTAGGTGAVSGSASGSDNALGTGNTHNLALSTATSGAKSGTVNVNSTSQAVANGTFAQNVNYNVLEHSQGSFDAASDVDAKAIDFGYVPAGFANRTAGFSVHNHVAVAGFTAGLKIGPITNGGSTAQLTTNAAANPNLAAGAQANFSATLSTATVGNLAATHTLAVADQDLPGATAGPSLVLSTTARVFTVATFDYTGHMDLLAGETLNTGPFRVSDGVTLTRGGPGTMNVTGAQNNGPGSVLVLNGGPNTFATDAGSPTNRALTVHANAPTTFNATQHLAGLHVGAGAAATFSADGSRMLVTDALTIAATGALNLHDNDLVVGYSGASLEGAIRGMVADGRITFDAGDNDVALAIADNAEWAHDTFNGESLATNTIVGKYTYFGDANLDGKVTSDDYVAVDVGLGTGNSWIEGDFNFSGTVSSDDYVAIDVNLGKGTATPLGWAELKSEMVALHTEMFGAEYVEKLAYAEANGFAATLVPEPAALGVLIASGLLFVRPRGPRASVERAGVKICRGREMTYKRSIRCASAAIGVACALAAPAIGGVRRDDRADSLYTDLGTDPRHAGVGFISLPTGGATGTLISPKWVLTAAHVTDTTDTPIFSYGGTSRHNGTPVLSAQHFFHPSWAGDPAQGWDIGLIRLNTPVTTITPASRFTLSNDIGRVGTSVGFGRTGVGSTGHDMTTWDGLKRGGTNVLDVLGNALSPGWSTNIIASDFDDPDDADGLNPFGSELPTDLEYMVSFSDSGGGTFVDSGGRSYLAAVHSFIAAFNPPTGDGLRNASYSDIHGSMRVNAFNLWLDDTIVNHWTTGTSGSFGTGSNWSQGAVAPGTYDIAGLNVAGTYTINFSSAVTNERLLARSGDVTLNLAGATYTLASNTYEGSLVVGKYSGNNAHVRFAGGTVNTKDAVIAELPGSVGQVTVGSGATWNCATDAYVGGAFLGSGGTGTVHVNPGGTLAVAGTMKLFAGGTLDLAGGSASAGLLKISGGTLSGTGTFASPITSQGGAANVASGTLNLTGALTSTAGTTLTKTGAGTLVLAGTQSHGTGAALQVTGGTARLDTDAGTAANATLGVTVNSGAAAQFNVTQHLASLNLAAGALATLAQGGSRMLSTKSLLIAAGGTLNLHDNDLLVPYTTGGASLEAAIRNMVIDGRITHDAGSNDVTLAIADNAEWGHTTFNGESIGTNTIVGKYTYFGDANLDGKVTSDDYVAVDVGLGTGNSWVQGDFNFSGTVTSDDYVAIDVNLGKGTPTPLAFAELKAEMVALHTEMFGAEYLEKLALAESDGFQIVPEPAGLATIFLSGLVLIRSRRRRRDR